MASAESDIADSLEEVTTFGPVFSAGGSSSSSTGVKRGLDGHVVGREQEASDAAASAGDYPMERTKKRKTGTASRGVANLTPEQLAKKRANGMLIAALILFWIWTKGQKRKRKNDKKNTYQTLLCQQPAFDLTTYILLPLF